MINSFQLSERIKSQIRQRSVRWGRDSAYGSTQYGPWTGRYLNELTYGFVAEHFIHEWVTFYNIGRPQTALNMRPPGAAYFSGA